MRAPNVCSSPAVRRPIRPYPTINTGKPARPQTTSFGHSRRCTAAFRPGKSRSNASAAPKVISATAAVGPSGVFDTLMPNSAAAARSTFSMPIPTRASAFSRPAEASTRRLSGSKPASNPSTPSRCAVISASVSRRRNGLGLISTPAARNHSSGCGSASAKDEGAMATSMVGIKNVKADIPSPSCSDVPCGSTPPRS